MRHQALILLVICLCCAFLFTTLCLDFVLDWTFEHSLETVTRAQADIDHLHFDLFKLTLSIDRFQLANPRNTWRNLFETKNFSVKLLTEPFFSGKVVVDQITINELILNTPRKTDGKLKRKLLPGPLGKAQAKLNRDIAAIPILDPNQVQQGINPEKLLAGYSFKLDSASDGVKTDIEATRTQWDKDIHEVETVKTRIALLQLKLDKFKESKPKNIFEIKQKIDQAKELDKEIKTFKNQVSQTKDHFKNDFDQLSGTIHNLKDIAEGDYQSLLKLAKLPNFGSFNAAEALFGKSLLNESTTFITLMDALNAYVPPGMVNNNTKEAHPRGGQNITFPGRHTYPRFLIRQISISGRGTNQMALDGYYAKGTVQGVTSEPLLYGQPLRFSMLGQAPSRAYLQINGALNQASPTMNGDVNLKIGGLALPAMELSDSPYLPSKLTSGRMYVISAANFSKNGFKLDVKLEGSQLVSDYSGKPEPTDLGMEIIRQTFSRLDRLIIDYQLEYRGAKFQMDVSSNIDELLKQRFKEVIGEKVAEATKKLRDKVNTRLAEKQAQLETIRQKYQAQYQSKIDEVQASINAQNDALEQKRKELEEQLKSNPTSSLLKRFQ